MFSKHPPVWRGLTREWGKAINLERPGTRGQATRRRLQGRLTGFQRAAWLAEHRQPGLPAAAQIGRCGSRGVASVIKSPCAMTGSSSDPTWWKQWVSVVATAHVAQFLPRVTLHSRELLPPYLHPLRGGRQDLLDPGVPPGPGCRPGQPVLEDPSRPGSRTSRQVTQSSPPPSIRPITSH